MRTPVEIWLKEHRQAYERADRLVEILSPDDILAQLTHPEQDRLRKEIADLLDGIAGLAEGHFRSEENLLVPIIRKYLEPDARETKEALGCLAREHVQMHMFAARILDLLVYLRSDDPLNASQAAELLRVSYGVQSLLRHHCSKEEREVFPLVGKLPMKAVEELMEKLGPSDDIPLDHLIKPLGKPGDGNGTFGDGAGGPEN